MIKYLLNIFNLKERKKIWIENNIKPMRNNIETLRSIIKYTSNDESHFILQNTRIDVFENKIKKLIKIYSSPNSKLTRMVINRINYNISRMLYSEFDLLNDFIQKEIPHIKLSETDIEKWIKENASDDFHAELNSIKKNNYFGF